MSSGGWIGVDLDGTLAYWEPGQEWDGISIGAPIPLMVARVKDWLLHGIEVRIVTARVAGGDSRTDAERQRREIVEWCMKHIGYALPVTASKDFQMIELWDDRAVRVETNTGMIA